MTQTFILQNQSKLFFGKSKEWVDGYDANAVYKTLHKDEAINQMVEISAKDYTQRVKILTCEINEKGLPVIDAELMPAPLPKAPKSPIANASLFDDTEAEEPEGELEFLTGEADNDQTPNQNNLL
jgi:hypothetical protein